MTKRILVVEDQEDNMQILRDLLSNAGYEMIEALDGEAGVRIAVSERPDLILMDIQLPLLDGYEATRQIRAEAKAHAAGCDGYVSKPYSPRLLLAKIREYLPNS
jgi:two-component system, cell cycle response regulator DivK